MYPTLLELGPIPIYSYGVLLATAYLVGLKLAILRSTRRGLDPNRVMDLGILIIISALLGAKLMLFVVEFDYYSQSACERVESSTEGFSLPYRSPGGTCDATGCPPGRPVMPSPLALRWGMPSVDSAA